MTPAAEPAPQVTRTGLRLRFRRLTEADVAAVMALEGAVQSHPWRRSSYDDCLQGRHHCWLAEVEGTAAPPDRLAGFVVASWAVGEAELLNLAVAPNWQRRGVGQCLLTLLRSELGGRARTLFLEVRLSNESAVAFYQSEQFFEVGHRPNYYPSKKGREDALIMALELSND